MSDFLEFVRAHRPDFEAHVEKAVHGKIRRFLNDPQMVRLYNDYGMEPFRRSSVLNGMSDFLLHHADTIRGRVCVEIGSAHGLTAIVLSRFFAKVISIDVEPSSIKRRIADSCGVGDRVTFYDIRDNSGKSKILDRWLDFDFDFAYVDGDHARDTLSDFKLVRNCGKVLFDEYWPAQPPVWDLVNSLPADEVVTGGDRFALWIKKSVDKNEITDGNGD